MQPPLLEQNFTTTPVVDMHRYTSKPLEGGKWNKEK